MTELTARELFYSWKEVQDNPVVTEEPTDGRPLRGLCTVWRRREDGLWRPDRDPEYPGVPFAALHVLRLRELASAGPVEAP